MRSNVFMLSLTRNILFNSKIRILEARTNTKYSWLPVSTSSYAAAGSISSVFFSIKRAARTQIQATKSLMIFRDSVFPLDSSVVCVWQCRCSLTLNSAAIEMFLTTTEFVRVCDVNFSLWCTNKRGLQFHVSKLRKGKREAERKETGKSNWK